MLSLSFWVLDPSQGGNRLSGIHANDGRKASLVPKILLAFGLRTSSVRCCPSVQLDRFHALPILQKGNSQRGRLHVPFRSREAVGTSLISGHDSISDWMYRAYPYYAQSLSKNDLKSLACIQPFALYLIPVSTGSASWYVLSSI
jgi:hypothetical protein